MKKSLVAITAPTGAEQFSAFMRALSEPAQVPVILPKPAATDGIRVPDCADFAVATSGTTGKPKLYFRTRASWQDFLPVQNRAFGIGGDTVCFLHGSLSFTGNLNIAFQLHCAGAQAVFADSLRAESWAAVIRDRQVNTLYLIPDKLLHLCRTGAVFPQVRTIVCGSQLISQKLHALIKASFPNASVFLYYGTSEVSYVAYKRLPDAVTDDDERCVGTVFDGVQVSISSERHILVTSPSLVCGASAPYDTGDIGYFEGGRLYFAGRSDDVLSMSGEKINKATLIRRLLSVDGIEECDIAQERRTESGREYLVAHIAGARLPRSIPADLFADIPSPLAPKAYVRHRRLPRTASGKIALPAATP